MKGGLLGRPRTIIAEDIRIICEISEQKENSGPSYIVRVSSYTTDTVRERTEKLRLTTPSGLVFRVKNRHSW